MTIGTSLHHMMASRHFTRLDTEISALQAQIASGTNDPRASVDPVRSLNMSATRDQKELVMQFSDNLAAADNRLSVSDTVLGQVGGVLNRLAEISIRGASASVSEGERASLLIEAEELRGSILSLALSRDSAGRALFGGYQTRENAFVDTGNGIQYVGDDGRHELRVSESAKMSTSLNGLEVFMEVPVQTADGMVKRDLFSIVDDVVHSLTAGGGDRKDTIDGVDAMRLQLGRTRGEVSMTLTGPTGNAQISAPYMAGSMDALIAAINAETLTTGITASVDLTDPTAIRLDAVGDFSLSKLNISGGNNRDHQQIEVTHLGGPNLNKTETFVDQERTANAMIGMMSDATFHIADRRGEIGALQQVGERHASALDRRTEMIERALAGYEGLDIAAAVTELQAMMMNREAAQQTYAKISVRTLFDFLG